VRPVDAAGGGEVVAIDPHVRTDQDLAARPL
jgi:hypothetical protein